MSLTVENNKSYSESTSNNKRGSEILSVSGAFASAIGANAAGKKIYEKATNKILGDFGTKKLDKLTPEFVENIFNETKLPKRGVSLINTALDSFEITNNNYQLEGLKNLVQAGVNAYYYPKTKNVIIDTDKIDVAFFHEMGHGLNYTGKGVGRMLSYCRGATKLAPIILLVAALRKPKQKKEESTTIFGKCLDFIKEHAVGLTVATQMPLILEEGLASLKGAKIAKKYLSAKELRAVNLNNLRGLGSYIAMAAIPVLATAVANIVRNKTCKDTKTAVETSI